VLVSAGLFSFAIPSRTRFACYPHASDFLCRFDDTTIHFHLATAIPLAVLGDSILELLEFFWLNWDSRHAFLVMGHHVFLFDLVGFTSVDISLKTWMKILGGSLMIRIIMRSWQIFRYRCDIVDPGIVGTTNYNRWVSKGFFWSSRKFLGLTATTSPWLKFGCAGAGSEGTGNDSTAEIETREASKTNEILVMMYR